MASHGTRPRTTAVPMPRDHLVETRRACCSAANVVSPVELQRNEPVGSYLAWATFFVLLCGSECTRCNTRHSTRTMALLALQHCTKWHTTRQRTATDLAAGDSNVFSFFQAVPAPCLWNMTPACIPWRVWPCRRHRRAVFLSILFGSFVLVVSTCVYQYWVRFLYVSFPCACLYFLYHRFPGLVCFCDFLL